VSGLPDRVLVVDDEHKQTEILRSILEREGYEVETASSAEEAEALVRANPPDVVLTDLRLPGRDGIELLEAVHRGFPQVGVVLVTAHGTIPTAVEAMKRGALDYLTKPLTREAVVACVRGASQRARELRAPAAEPVEEAAPLPDLIGEHEGMREVFRMVRKVGPTASNVLVCGESGTGKELVARAIHDASPRAERSFHPVNCAAIPETLIESELFGHERGSFTGATGRKVGLFEEASGGTLFLDEIGELPVGAQAKLLRAVQEREIRRIGATGSIPVDVRLVAATNADLPERVRAGTFRADLYYRLSVITIALPPLRERRSDIPALVEHFLARRAQHLGRAGMRIDDEALAHLERYDWPGNVRELESVLERAVTLAEDAVVTTRDLPAQLQERSPAAPGDLVLPSGGLHFDALERDLLVKALKQSGGNASAAARLLGMSRRTFQYRMQKFGIRRAGEREAPET
jgi:DNA-binding NtrC family response regulator